MTVLFLLIASVFATTATQLSGRVQISGFSFQGKIPATIYLGEQNEIHLQLLRPSGLSIMSFTYTGTEVCVLFDLDSTQYIGSSQEFDALTNNKIQSKELIQIFRPNPSTSEQWLWNEKNTKLRRAVIQSDEKEDLIRVRYQQWKKGEPSRLSVHLLENNWRLKANIQDQAQVDWTFSCDSEQGYRTLALSMLKNSIAPSKN